eukprot:4486246-Alexandrium_andersonii.AAC.1
MPSTRRRAERAVGGRERGSPNSGRCLAPAGLLEEARTTSTELADQDRLHRAAPLRLEVDRPVNVPGKDGGGLRRRGGSASAGGQITDGL